MDSASQHSGAPYHLRWLWLVGLLVASSLFTMIIGGHVLWKRNKATAPTTPATFFAERYHAIFLTNGTLYFSRVEKQDEQFVILRDTYIVQQQTAPQAGQPQFKLVRMSDAVHRPTDDMYVNRDHVIYLQELQPESPALRTIESALRGQ